MTLTEAYADILGMPKSTFMATYRNGAEPLAFERWARQLDIREIRKEDGKKCYVVCVHCDRARVEELHDELAKQSRGGTLSIVPSELATRFDASQQAA